MARDLAVPSKDVRPAVRGRTWLDVVLFALSATGVPIALLALMHLGRLGGLLLEIAIGALGVRAWMMVAVGTGRWLQPVPRLLLVAETALDSLGVVAGLWTWVWQPFVRAARPKRVTTGTWMTPVAVAVWLAASVIHTARMAIYISPLRGLWKA
jgi:hypothetical protein